MAKRVTNRNTKAEILDAYAQLKEELKEAKQDASAPAQAAPVAAQPESKTTTKKVVPMNSVDQVLKSLSTLRMGFGDAINTLSGQLTTEAQTLHDIREAATTHTTDIETLHGLTIEEGTLPNLIVEYQRSKTAFDDDLETSREAAQMAWAELQEAWTEAKAERKQRTQERNALLAKERKRDEAEYRYDLELRRKRVQDTYDQEVWRLEQTLETYEMTAREGLAAREDSISEREIEYETLQEKVEGFSTELEKRVSGARKEGEGIAKKQARVKADLEAKTHEGKRRVFELRISSLNEMVTAQAQQLATLTESLMGAQKQAQELAVKALEGASNATSFEAVRQIAMEQAKHTSKSK